MATSGSFGYVISRIPLETLVSKVRLHEMLIGQFGILASRFNTTFPEFQLEHEQLDLECQTLVYRMTVLLSLMEAGEKQRLSQLDTYVQDHLSHIMDLKSYVDQNGTFASLIKGLKITDEEFERLNHISPFKDPFQQLPDFPLEHQSDSEEQGESGSQEANQTEDASEDAQGNPFGQLLIQFPVESTTTEIPQFWFNQTEKMPETSTYMESEMFSINNETDGNTVPPPLNFLENQNETELQSNLLQGGDDLNDTTTISSFENSTYSSTFVTDEITTQSAVTSTASLESSTTVTEAEVSTIALEDDLTTVLTILDDVIAESVLENVTESVFENDTTENETIDTEQEQIMIENYIILNENVTVNNSTLAETNLINLTDSDTLSESPEEQAFKRKYPHYQGVDLDTVLRNCSLPIEQAEPADFSTYSNYRKYKVQGEIIKQIIAKYGISDREKLNCFISKIQAKKTHVSGSGAAANRRGKRQIAEVVSAISLANSIYNSVKIASIQSQMGSLGSLVDTVVSQMETQASKINELTIKINKCFDACRIALLTIGKLTARIQLGNLLHTLKISQNGLRILLTNLELGLEKLSLNRLSPFFVTKDAVIASWENLKESARKQGMLVSGVNEKILFASETSVFSIRGLPYFIIEVGLTPIKNTFSIYKFMPSPVTLKNMTFHFRPKHTYLIIDELKSVSKEISQSEFDTCHRTDLLYHCKFERVYSKGVKHRPSCLARLFNNNYAEISEYCPLVVDSGNAESITEISINTFKIHSVKGTTVHLNCKNVSLSRQITVKGTEIITLPSENCEGSSPNYIFFGSISLLTEFDIFDSHALFSNEQLLGFSVLQPHDMAQLRSLIKSMKKEAPLKEINVNEIKKRFYDKQMSLLYNVHNYRTEIYIGGFLLMIGLCLPCCYWWRRRLTTKSYEKIYRADEARTENVTVVQARPKSRKREKAPARPLIQTATAPVRDPSDASTVEMDHPFVPAALTGSEIIALRKLHNIM